MTPREVQTNLIDLESELGGGARLSVSFSSYSTAKPIVCRVFPRGLGDDSCETISAETWPGLFAKIGAAHALFLEREKTQSPALEAAE